MVKKDIGEILVSMGAITPDRLQECYKAIEQTHQNLVDYLREKQIVPSEDIAKAYAELMGLPYIAKVTEKMADPVLLAKIPLKFLRFNVVMPVTIDDKIVILTANPSAFQPLDELNLLLGGGTDLAVSTPEIIIDGINRYYPLEGAKQMIEELEEEKAPEAVAFEEIEEKDILAMATEAPIIKLVNHILVQAVKRGASDIHIEPFEKEVRVRYRIDGVMYPAFNPPKRIQGALISRIKIMANMNIAEKRLPKGGRIAIKVADKAIDIRVSVLPVSFGERVVMRLLDKTRTFGKIKELGLSDHDLCDY